jgi:hypothetical protein
MAHSDVPCTSLQQIPMHLFRTVALSTLRRVGSLASHWLQLQTKKRHSEKEYGGLGPWIFLYMNYFLKGHCCVLRPGSVSAVFVCFSLSNTMTFLDFEAETLR